MCIDLMIKSIREYVIYYRFASILEQPDTYNIKQPILYMYNPNTPFTMTKQEAYSYLSIYHRKLFLLITKQLICMQRQHEVDMRIQTNSAIDANLTGYTYDNNLFDYIDNNINYNTLYQDFTPEQFNTLLSVAEGRPELFNLQEVHALFPNVNIDSVIDLIMNFINNIVLNNVICAYINNQRDNIHTLFEILNDIYIENISTHNYRTILNIDPNNLNEHVAINFIMSGADILTDANIRTIYNILRPPLT